MYVEAIDLDVTDWELRESLKIEGSLRGAPVCVLGEKWAMHSVRFDGVAPQKFSLTNRKIEPMMSRISEVSVEYKHTNSDGSSDSIKGDVKFNEDKGTNNNDSTSANNDNDTRASDVDSRDRDQDRDSNDD